MADERIEITVTMHPAYWATVLGLLRVANRYVDAQINRGLEGGTLRPSEATSWVAHNALACRPITNAARTAVSKHSAWARWFTDGELDLGFE